MTKVKLASRLSMIVPLALLVACGGERPDAATGHPPEVAPWTPTTEAPPPAPPDAPGPAASAEPSAVDAGSVSEPAKTPAAVEPKDDCTPVGVDFEKRARPKLKECYAEGKKKDPNLEGTVKIKITVDVKGKIKSTKIVEKTLPDPVANCMLKVIKTTPFPEVDKCWDATLTIPVTFPTPK